MRFSRGSRVDAAPAPRKKRETRRKKPRYFNCDGNAALDGAPFKELFCLGRDNGNSLFVSGGGTLRSFLITGARTSVFSVILMGGEGTGRTIAAIFEDGGDRPNCTLLIIPARMRQDFYRPAAVPHTGATPKVVVY